VFYMMKIKIFLSGSLFLEDWQSKAISELGNDNFLFLNPRRHGLSDSFEYTQCDLFYLDLCDIFLGYMQKENPSGFGLSFELGYAVAKGKLTILVDEKSLSDSEFKKKFEIVREACILLFENIDGAIDYIKNIDKGVF